MDSATDPWFFTTGVSPFGHPRVKAYFQLTAAFRRLSRPSSALGAKAFTLCSFSLEQLRLLRSLVLSDSILFKFASCLSFANNCLFWVVLKRPFLSKLHFLHCFPPPNAFASDSDLVVCSHFRKDLRFFSDLSLYNYLFVSFFSIRFSMNICLIVPPYSAVLVGSSGLEPPTKWLSGRSLSPFATHLAVLGGLKWTRTTDLPLIRRVL